MKTSDAYNLILFIENKINIDIFEYKSFKTWPLLRSVLYRQLVFGQKNKPKTNYLNKLNFYKFLINRYLQITENKKNIRKKRNITKIFFSRPTYLVNIGSKARLFDKLVDPIILGNENKDLCLKIYTSNLKKGVQLINEGYVVKTPFDFFKSVILSDLEISEIANISKMSGLNCQEIISGYKSDLEIFSKWYKLGKKLFLHHSSLINVYLCAWYFPDMMGICAAASELGISTIDIQHGKQGIYHPCYSGWQKIPKDGYDLVPDYFWCWGKPSYEHILRASPSRTKHIPFIGGYPWINYYKVNLQKKKNYHNKNSIRVLITLQPLGGFHTESIPDFVLKFLKNLKGNDIHFNFRIHPNDSRGIEYVKKRLELICKDLYTIESSEVCLYDSFSNSTHHITACSSCCYEAQVFGLPSLLFGIEAREIYDYEIKNNIFTWTNGNMFDLEKWLKNNKAVSIVESNSYIST